jgi:hypothetical protein
LARQSSACRRQVRSDSECWASSSSAMAWAAATSPLARCAWASNTREELDVRRAWRRCTISSARSGSSRPRWARARPSYTETR